NDVVQIALARNTPATGPDDPRDANGDGIITIRDARACVLQCTLPRCTNIDPPVEVPTIDVSPDSLDFGDVFVGSSASLPLGVENTGTATLSVSNIGGSGAPFSVFPPLAFDIADGGLPRSVDIGFSPTVAGLFNGTVTINSNADNTDPVLVSVTGRGIEPAPELEADIDHSDSIDFGAIAEEDSVEQLLTVRNLGDAPLNVDDISSDNAAFVASALPSESIPFTLDPGATRNISVVFTAPPGSAGTTIDGNLTITSNDPDESPSAVLLTGDVTLPIPALVNIPILGASVDDIIGNGNCGIVSGEVQFGQSDAVDAFNVTLMDQGGVSASSGFFTSDDNGGVVAFSGIDACDLDDGILELTVNLGSLDPYVGTPAIKNTGVFPAPVLDPVAAASVLQTIEVCGTSREDTTVTIAGGANAVSIALDNVTTDFCLDVALRPNTENTLIATAVDDIAAAPKPSASASPIQVVHVDPASVIIAEATSRPLTIEETELLVQNGVIDLDDPSNFNVSMFTIVLTIG
ncbi:MAG: choice-of-anchor D domain-containing protein, partial [Gammaproteobacteria bacterium]|nr:choice-of-anchor D domain-containing protein [Gammaproteobacteria bacterium]